MSERIERLRDAVEKMYHCKAQHVASNPVRESFQKKVAWEGVVETFDLNGHPKAKGCYAWSFRENGDPKYTTVLEIPPVNSPESAVKVAIAAKGKR